MKATAGSTPATLDNLLASRPIATASWRWSGRRRNSIRSSRSSPSCARRRAQSRSRRFSRRTRKRSLALLAGERRARVPHARSPAPTRSRRTSPGARRAPRRAARRNGRASLPKRGRLDERRRSRCSLCSGRRSSTHAIARASRLCARDRVSGRGEGACPRTPAQDRGRGGAAEHRRPRRVRSRGRGDARARRRRARCWCREWNRASPRRSSATGDDRAWSARSVLVGAGGALAEIYRDFALRARAGERGRGARR